MATFVFKAVDLAGVPTRGELVADDKQAVTSQLRGKGLIDLDIEEKKTTDIGDYFGRFKRVKAQELTVATRQLATMIQSGMSLLRALYVLEEQARSDKFRDALVAVRMDVEAGIGLSDALSRHPTIFNELYIAMVGAGEAGGILEETLERVADQLEKDDSLRRQVKAALMYPILISTFALVVLLALVAFLVPVFEKVFKEFGGHLPAITQFTVDFSHIVTGAPYLIVGGGVGIVVGFRKWKKSSRGAQQWDRFKLKVPWKIGDFYEDEVAAGWKALTSILEPLMIILVGAIVGFIVVAMYMPMFKVYDNIR